MSSPETPGRLTIDEVYRMALAAHGAGDVARAIQIYDVLLNDLPDHPALLIRRGVAAREVGDAAGAVAFLQRAAVAAPTDGEILSNLGNALADVGDPAAAGAHLRAASLAPDHHGVLINAGAYLVRAGRPAEARPLLDWLLAMNPRHALARGLSGDVLKAAGEFDLALNAMRLSLELEPGDPDRWYNLAQLQYAEGLFAQATAAYRRSLELRPDHPPALTGLGLALLDGRESVAAHERALAIDPNFLQAAGNRAAALLRAGEWRVGWEAWEFRHRQLLKHRDDLPEIAWTGEPLSADQPLWLWAEQGLGDVIMMLRYLPAVSRRAARVTLELHPGLGALAHSLPDGVEAIERGAARPAGARHLPTASLPLLFSEPAAEFPYLSAPPGRADRWARRLAGRRPRVGLIWAGGPTHPNDRLRSRRLEDFSPLLRQGDADFFSLQVGPAREQLDRAPGRITDLADDLTDFGETAAVLSQLDLLISVDTSTLNLAGAMGLASWGLLPPNPDWRWGLAEASPWYPTLRLFRRRLDAAGDAEPGEDFMARVGDAFAMWLRR